MKNQTSLRGLLAVVLSSSASCAALVQDTNLHAAVSTDAPDSWVHPGVYVSRQQLDYVSDKVAADEQPWAEAFDAMLNVSYISPTRTANPYKTVECGPTSTPNIGCYEEREDSMAAYMNALAWWITKDKQYAEKSIHYMDAWSSTIDSHNNSNAPLQAGWSAANWVRAGEIMRSACAGWSRKSIDAFGEMLQRAYIPILADGDTKNNGNWDLVMMEAAIGAAVFLEDDALFENSMRLFTGRVPAYIYLKSDGDYPVPARGRDNSTAGIIRYWFNQATYPVSGITQETCRDFAHTSYGISSISHVAETLRIQGKDVWSTDLGARVEASLELHASFDSGERPIPEWLCRGAIPRRMNPMLEPAYNTLSFNMGHKMPFTKKLLLEQRPAQIGEPNPLFVGFETLTNAEILF